MSRTMRMKHFPTTCLPALTGLPTRSRWWGFWLIWALWLSVGPVFAAVEESSTTTPSEAQEQEMDQTTSSQESEAKGIIPESADTLVSTQPITPISTFTEKTPYEEAKA